MAAGLPVVADKGSFSSIPEFTNGEHGLVANDAATMIVAINRLLDSSEFRVELGQHARDLVRRHFKWSDRIQEVYCRLTAALYGKAESV